jgi:polyisoprenoid-binding protein YceI
MRKISLAGTALVALVLLSRDAGADDYRISPEASEIVARVFKGGVAAGLAHDHVIRASQLSGEIHLDAKNPERSMVRVEIPVRSLVADEPAVRRKYRVEKELDSEDRAEIQSTMLGEDQLDAAKYPLIRFESKEVRAEGRGRFVITGELLVHGHSRTIQVPVEAHTAPGRIEARGSFAIKQTDFGIEPFSVALGGIRNKDEVKISFSIVATASGDREPAG